MFADLVFLEGVPIVARGLLTLNDLWLGALESVSIVKRGLLTLVREYALNHSPAAGGRADA
jgi:hypothetical protein